MKTLLVLRHGKSSWKDPGLEDHERPLSRRGKKAVPRMGKLLRKKGIIPDLIICSTALRAKKTAGLVAETSGYSGAIRLDRRLYLAGPAEMVGLIRRAADEHVRCLMIVGHNPGQAELIRTLTGENQRFPTAALARIELAIERWEDLGPETKARLLDLWRPKELED